MKTMALGLALAACMACAPPSSWRRELSLGDRALHHGRYAEAEELLEAALKRAEGFGPQDPRLAESLSALADLYYARGEYHKAEPLYRRALEAAQRAWGPESPEASAALVSLADLLSVGGRGGEAEKLYQRALGAAEKDPRRLAELAQRPAHRGRPRLLAAPQAWLQARQEARQRSRPGLPLRVKFDLTVF